MCELLKIVNIWLIQSSWLEIIIPLELNAATFQFEFDPTMTIVSNVRIIEWRNVSVNRRYISQYTNFGGLYVITIKKYGWATFAYEDWACKDTKLS